MDSENHISEIMSDVCPYHNVGFCKQTKSALNIIHMRIVKQKDAKRKPAAKGTEENVETILLVFL